MSNLIKNELTKIFKKKGIYITLFIILAFVILTNCILKFFYDNTSYYYASNDEYIGYLREEMESLDPTNPNDVSLYIGNKTQIDLYELSEKYEDNSWQQYVINSQMYDYILEKNTQEFSIEKDEQKIAEANEQYDNMLERLNQDDWKYFANLELEGKTKELEELKNQRENTQRKDEIISLDTQIANKELEIDAINYRIDKDIIYGNDFRNQQLSIYVGMGQQLNQLEAKTTELDYSEKQQYNSYKEDFEKAKYMIENNQNIVKMDDLRGVIMQFFSQYELFIIVLIIMVAGVIVSEEFNKGTVKLLLVRPYSRTKILAAKYITTILMILFAIIVVVVMQLIVGGILFGFDSLQIPAVEYDFNTNSIVTMNPLVYLGIQALAKLPMYILVATMAFGFSTIFTNSAVAIIISFLGYMSTSIINSLVIMYKVNFMKYFITMNWNLDSYLFGKLPEMEGMTMTFSAVICIAYLIIMLVPTFIIFKKKNIKNI